MTAAPDVPAYLRAVLRALAVDNVAMVASAREFEAAGGRIIAGESACPPDSPCVEAGVCTPDYETDLETGHWEIVDPWTGERLAHGGGGHDRAGEAVVAMFGEAEVIHTAVFYDRLSWPVTAEPETLGPSAGVPEGLARALFEWVLAEAEYAEHVAEVADLCGVDEAEVTRCIAGVETILRAAGRPA